MRIASLAIAVLWAVCIGQTTYAFGTVYISEPFDPDDWIDARVEIRESGVIPAVWLAGAITAADSGWQYVTTSWEIGACDYVDAICGLTPVDPRTPLLPVRYIPHIPVTSSPILIDFYFPASSHFTTGTWASIKNSF